MNNYEDSGYNSLLRKPNLSSNPQRLEESLLERGAINIFNIKNDALFIQDQKSPGTVINGTSIGGTAWGTPTNARASDDIYTAAIIVSPGTSNYLQASDFRFSIPQKAVINGIGVFVEKLR